MFKRKSVRAGAMLLLIGGGMVLVLLRVPLAPDKRFTAPDGSVFRLVGATFGTNQVFQFHPRFPWLETLLPVIPASLRPHVGFQSFKGPAPRTGGLGLWFRMISGPTNTNANLPIARRVPQTTIAYNAATHDPVAYLELMIVDETGVTSDFDKMSLRNTGNLITAPTYFALAQQFPSHARTVPVRLYEHGKYSAPLAQWDVPNPAPAPLPDWVAEPVPAHRQTNGLEVSLTEFALDKRPGTAASRPLSTLHWQYEVKSDGKVTDDWGIAGAAISNDVGQSEQFVNPNPRYMGIVMSRPASGHLWASDPAWRVHLEFMQTAGFGATNSWTNSGVPLPAVGQSIILAPPINAPAAAYSIIVNLERRAVSVSLPPPEGKPNLMLSVAYPRSMRVLMPKMVYDAASVAYDAGGMPGDHRYSCSYWVPDDAKTLDIVFAVSPVYAFDFTVKPGETVRTNK